MSSSQAPIQIPPDREYDLRLSAQSINIILNALANGVVWIQADSLMKSIREQIEEAERPATKSL